MMPFMINLNLSLYIPQASFDSFDSLLNVIYIYRHLFKTVINSNGDRMMGTMFTQQQI